MQQKIGRVLLYNRSLVGAGGGERLMFEEAGYFESLGIGVDILTADYDAAVHFGSSYRFPITVLPQRRMHGWPKHLQQLMSMLTEVIDLRRWLLNNKPDVVIAQRAGDSIPIGIATLFTRTPYVVHINGTVFWFDNAQNLYKYSILHKRVFDTIRSSLWGHLEFYPREAPNMSLVARLAWEAKAVLMLWGVRRASEVINFTNRMAWEVELLYRRKGRVIRGAVPRTALNYLPKQDIKAKLGLGGKAIILNVNRLEKRKRVSLTIRAFSLLASESKAIHLLIGGTGPEESDLKSLVRVLSLDDRVSFVGFIPERDLWDFYGCCDVFVHPNWADHALAPYEALAMQKKVVWTTEMEMEDAALKHNRHIFPADPTAEDLAAAISSALAAGEVPADDLSGYTWENYCAQVLHVLEGVVERQLKKRDRRG